MLAARPSEHWEKLFALADALTDADLEVTWEGGPEPGEEGVSEMPHAIYSDALDAVLSVLVGLQVIVPFDWSAWHRATPLFPDGNGLDQAPVADAARLATTFIRAERFSEGTIQEAIQSGALHAILRRLRHWYQNERQ
ncbi:DUF6508 domain-containing protein [Acrocarpospora pleiomorpha]|uniref:DUF6508 domain-containing protein n=1 Tax=Acrocarpospora pleiomorpha TaxID=90975 RepID=UPI001FE67D6B|nr:DUF6508 domain-containing protein [Acrocarpospora pleiomorpha]